MGIYNELVPLKGRIMEHGTPQLMVKVVEMSFGPSRKTRIKRGVVPICIVGVLFSKQQSFMLVEERCAELQAHYTPKKQ